MAVKAILSNLALTNVGCEIILRGTEKYLAEAFPAGEHTLVFPSYDAERDRIIMADCQAVTVTPMLTWKRYVRGVLRKTGTFLRLWTPRFSSSVFRQSDFFVSTGGDIYTMFDDSLPEEWIGHERYATRLNIPTVMLGANMERFEVLSEDAKQVLLEHLRRFAIIGVRDRETYDYLAQHEVCENVVIMPDPVFAVRPVATFLPGRLARIGVNLSPLAIESGAATLRGYVALVEELLKSGRDVVLIPHVASTSGTGSLHDPATLRAVRQRIDPKLAQRVSIYEGPIRLENLERAIAGVDAMVGARMHACLNALTLGKPTFFLGYSRKATSMVAWLRGDSPYRVVAGCVAGADLRGLSPSDVIQFLDQAESTLAELGKTVVDMRPGIARGAASVAAAITAART